MDRVWNIEDQVSILEAVMNQSEQILASSTVAAPPIFTNTVGISNQQQDGQGTGELDLSLFQRFASNRRVNEAAFISLIAAYSILIVIGTIGNSLVVYVVARQPAMRTARNVFVVNLAVSDLLLCLITMPLTVKTLKLSITITLFRFSTLGLIFIPSISIALLKRGKLSFLWWLTLELIKGSARSSCQAVPSHSSWVIKYTPKCFSHELAEYRSWT